MKIWRFFGGQIRENGHFRRFLRLDSSFGQNFENFGRPEEKRTKRLQNVDFENGQKVGLPDPTSPGIARGPLPPSARFPLSGGVYLVTVVALIIRNFFVSNSRRRRYRIARNTCSDSHQARKFQQ